jgi:hypothetical protein
MDRPNADNVRQNVTAGNSEAFCVLLQDATNAAIIPQPDESFPTL